MTVYFYCIKYMTINNSTSNNYNMYVYLTQIAVSCHHCDIFSSWCPLLKEICQYIL